METQGTAAAAAAAAVNRQRHSQASLKNYAAGPTAAPKTKIMNNQTTSN